jgi:transglutaminase-like putative cysteine protease
VSFPARKAELCPPALYGAALTFAFLQPFRARFPWWGSGLVWAGAFLFCLVIFAMLRRMESSPWPPFLLRLLARRREADPRLREAGMGWIYYRLVLAAVLLLFQFCYPTFAAKRDWAVAVKSGSLSALNGASTTVFLLFLFALTCFLFSSLLFYFTFVRFRFPALLLTALIPCLLAASQLRALTAAEAALLALSFLVAAWSGRWRTWGAAAPPFPPPPPLPLLLALAAAALLLVAAPRPDSTPGDFFRALYSYGLSDLGDSGDRSGPRLSLPDSRLVLEVEAPEPLYLRRQVFASFDGVDWRLPAPGQPVQSSPFSPGATADWAENQARLTGSALYALLQTAAAREPGFAARLPLDPAEAAPAPAVATAVVRHVDFVTRTLLLPGRTFRLEGLEPYYRAVVRDALGVTWLPGAAPLFAAEEYSAVYFREEGELWLAERLSGTTAAAYAALLDEAAAVLTAAADEAAMSEAARLGLFQAEAETARVFCAAAAGADYTPPAALTALAARITAGQEGDWLKARALEEYFHTNGFIYDTDYNPPRGQDDLASFVLEHKRGLCADFAAAMTIMARAVGLQARYVSGFYTGEADADGVYRVRAANAHAWVEVFIPGGGWMLFEPTPGYTAPAAAPWTLPAGCARALLPAALAGAALGWGARLAARPAEELLFRLRLRRCPRPQGVFRLYERTLVQAERALAQPAGRVTPRELAALLEQAYGLDISPLTGVYEKAAFADIAPTAAEFNRSYGAYRLLLRRLKSRD